MQGKALLVGVLALLGATQASAWEVQCEYGSSDQDNLFCEASDGFGEDTAFSVWHRAGEEEYGFAYAAPRRVEFVDGSTVEVRLDGGEVMSLGEIGFSSTSRESSFFLLSVPVSQAEALLAQMERADVLRLWANTKGEGEGGELYAEVPLDGFGGAIQTLRSRTR